MFAVDDAGVISNWRAFTDPEKIRPLLETVTRTMLTVEDARARGKRSRRA